MLPIFTLIFDEILVTLIDVELREYLFIERILVSSRS